MQKITPFLWFDNQAEEAAKFYTSVFKEGKIGTISRYGKEGYEVHHQKEGTALVVPFEIFGQQFQAINGGPVFKFNEAVSFLISCDNQAEVDYYWDKLGEGGDPRAQRCGWLKDKFGLTWQVVPKQLDALMADKDKAAAGRTMNAMLKMKKLDIAALQAAHDGK